MGIMGILLSILFLALLVSLYLNGFFTSNLTTNTSPTPTLMPTTTPTPTPNPTPNSAIVNTTVLLSGTVTTNEGVPTQIIFKQLSSSGSLTGKVYYSAIVSSNYSVVLPNKEFFAVSVDWTKPDGTAGTHHFIQPYGTNADVGVNSITCPFEWETASQ
jgi:hypothetical protein